ncbi:hypothetical protein BN946_scf184806.g41 [Trametes cinnabarina]|uniref:Uncharacterized protein n=1 Tax=Pycnoporus cinnabarinus TaxID=5643 RepID=A0A060SCU5_PYCCI|nr:hypothetical protein BN946_scf184806.g41 [Trametes cinnabarina]
MRAFLYTIVSFAALAIAQIESHDPNPPVLSPHSSTVWTVGATETVTWSTTGIIVNDPAGRPLSGKVVLGYLTGDSQRLWQSTPLAQGFLLSQKQTDVVVPDVPTGKYFIALEGDTGNWSQVFQINNPSEPSGTPPKSIVVTPVSSGAASSTTTADSSTSTLSASATTTESSSTSQNTTASGPGSSTSSSSAASTTSDASATSSSVASTSATATAPPSSTSGSSSSSLATVLSSTTSSSALPNGTNAPNSAQGLKAGVALPVLGLMALGAMAL